MMLHQKIDKIYRDSKIKQIILNYIYDNVLLYKFNYTQLKVTNDLSKFTGSEYIITPNYNGYICLLVFMKNKDRYYSFVIRRDTLPSKKENLIIDNVILEPVKLNLTYKIYDGTIFEGICYFDKINTNNYNKNYNKYNNMFNGKASKFIINDCYLFLGKEMFTENIKYKYMKIGIYLKKILGNKWKNMPNDNEDNSQNNEQFKNQNNEFNITLNKYYHLKDIKLILDEITNQDNLNYKCTINNKKNTLSNTNDNVSSNSDNEISDLISEENISLTSKYSCSVHSYYNNDILNTLKIRGIVFYPMINNSLNNNNYTRLMYNIETAKPFVINLIHGIKQGIKQGTKNKPIEHCDEHLNSISEDTDIITQLEPLDLNTNSINQHAYNLKQQYKRQEIKLKFIMKKTEIPDNYKLLLIDEIIKENNKELNNINNDNRHINKISNIILPPTIMFKTIFIDYAYIPTKDLSLTWFKEFITNNIIIADCIYLEDRNAWIPIEKSSKNNISTDIHKNKLLPNWFKDYLLYFEKKTVN